MIIDCIPRLDIALCYTLVRGFNRIILSHMGEYKYLLVVNDYQGICLSTSKSPDDRPITKTKYILSSKWYIVPGYQICFHYVNGINTGANPPMEIQFVND